jgi:hypothetical protein
MIVTRSDGESEKIFKKKVVNYMSQYFDIYEEVPSLDGTGRIDLVLVNKDNRDVVFGMELKKYDKKRGHDIGEWLLQAIRYSLSEFIVDGVKKSIPIVLAHGLSYDYIGVKDDVKVVNKRHYYADRHNGDHTHHTFNGIIGVFGLGELRHLKGSTYGFKIDHFIISFSNKEVWNNRNGCNNVKVNNYLPLLRGSKLSKVLKLDV